MLLHGHDNIVAGLERALAGQEIGARLSVTLMPAEAYGLRDETLVQQIASDDFASGGRLPCPGECFRIQGPDGPRVGTVLVADEAFVTLDANHPLAGETLRYSVEILAVRPASKAEISQGQPVAT